MASFTAGTTFVDGVANDVTAAKLGALITNATPTSGLIQDRTAETVVATNDTFLIGDASDSNTLKRMTVANVMKAELTGTINTTAGTITTLNSTTGTITTGVIPTLTSITKITSGTGTAAAPAISPTGDTNTGIFFPAADTIAFSEGGTEAMRIDSSGQVGINTNNASAKLDAQTTGNGWIGRFLNSTASGTPQGVQIVVGQNSTNAVLDVAQGTDYTTTTSLLNVQGNGNVGIGTASPATKLTVSGSSGTGSELRVVSTTLNTGGKVTLYENAAACWEINAPVGADGPFTIKDIYNNVERLRIDSSGNVGIGTNSPDDKLDVNGFAVLGTDTTTGQASTKFHKFKGTAVQSGASWFGSYGGLLLDTDSSFTANARKFLITNSLTANKFAIIRSTTATTNPSLGDVGAITSGTADFVITNAGEIGIGTDSPSVKLDVNGAIRADVLTSGTGTAAAPAIYPATDTNTGFFFPAADTIAFSEGGTEAMRINSSGNVSIGTATALSKLHVHGDLTMSNATTAVTASTSTITPPATVAGYLTVSINGTSRKIAYYAT